MFLAPPEERPSLIGALNRSGSEAGPVKFTDRGCETWQMRR